MVTEPRNSQQSAVWVVWFSGMLESPSQRGGLLLIQQSTSFGKLKRDKKLYQQKLVKAQFLVFLFIYGKFLNHGVASNVPCAPESDLRTAE